MNPDLQHFEQHYGMGQPYLTDHMWEVVEHLQVKCPVARQRRSEGARRFQQGHVGFDQAR